MGTPSSLKTGVLFSASLILCSAAIVYSAHDLYTAANYGVIVRESLRSSIVVSSRVRSEMRRIAERAVTLAATTLQHYQNADDRFRFVADNLAGDPSVVALAVYRVEKGNRFERDWRIVNPKLSRVPETDRASLAGFVAASKGEVGFDVVPTQGNGYLLRMTLPFMKSPEGGYSEVLAAELLPQSFAAILSELGGVSTYLFDREGIILSTSDFTHSTVGANMTVLSRALNTPERLAPGMREFTDSQGVRSLGAFRAVGFAGLKVVSISPKSLIELPQAELLIRSGLICLGFLLLGLGILRKIGGASQRRMPPPAPNVVPMPRKEGTKTGLTRTGT